MRDNEMDLLLRSFDDELDSGSRRELSMLLETSEAARAEHARMRRLRGLVTRSMSDTFAPLFADRVMARVQDGDTTNEEIGTRDHPEATGLGGGSSIEAIEPTDGTAKTRTARKDRRAMDRTTLRQRVRTGSWRLGAGFAVAALVVSAVGLALWLQPRTVTVPYGAMKTIELSDGSVAELSSGSTLTYRHFWGRDERRLKLEGEAFFDVAEAQRPFVVETFNASISVLGTRFNVRAWSTDPIPETSVALESGRVEVSPRLVAHERLASSTAESAAVRSEKHESSGSKSATDESAAPDVPTDERAAATARQGSESIVLEPGQTTSIVRDSTAVRPPQSINLEHVVSWRSGGLAFIDQPVGGVFRTIERRFNIDVRMADPSVKNRLLTYLNPRPGSAEDVLSDICHTLDLRYRQTANGFEILPSSAP